VLQMVKTVSWKVDLRSFTEVVKEGSMNRPHGSR
jgi:hypothetical protein